VQYSSLCGLLNHSSHSKIQKIEMDNQQSIKSIMPDNGIHALLITTGIIDESPGYSDADNEADKKRNIHRPKYASD
jgi:hypothetical protein